MQHSLWVAEIINSNFETENASLSGAALDSVLDKKFSFRRIWQGKGAQTAASKVPCIISWHLMVLELSLYLSLMKRKKKNLTKSQLFFSTHFIHPFFKNQSSVEDILLSMVGVTLPNRVCLWFFVIILNWCILPAFHSIEFDVYHTIILLGIYDIWRLYNLFLFHV